MKVFSIKLNEADYNLLKTAAKKSYDADKHKKSYGVGTFIKEASISKAKRVVKK